MDTLHIPDSYIYKTGERVIPGSVTDDALIEHCSRYYFASEFCKNKIVLNVSSGAGYGSVIMLKKAKEIFNVDISENSIAYGNKLYGAFNNHFLKMDAQKLIFPDNFFDIVVSFETIEHLKKPNQFIDECHRVLKKNGVLILSTPNKLITSHDTNRPKNKFHFHEWDIYQVKKILSMKFRTVSLYGQNFIPQEKSYSKTKLLFYTILGVIMNATPGILYKYIKRSILRYRDHDLLHLKINNKNKVVLAKDTDFVPDSQKMAYAIMMLVLRKK